MMVTTIFILKLFLFSSVGVLIRNYVQIFGLNSFSRVTHLWEINYSTVWNEQHNFSCITTKLSGKLFFYDINLILVSWWLQRSKFSWKILCKLAYFEDNDMTKLKQINIILKGEQWLQKMVNILNF
jgi:hypothetical protein